MKIATALARLLCLAVLVPGTALFAQSPAPATYDVAAIRPADPSKPRGTITSMLTWGKDNLKGDNITVEMLMASAFNVRADQISGAPGWAKDQHFDIDAKLTDITSTAADRMTEEQHRALMRALLVERFGMKFHEAEKVMPIYELQPGREGLKLKPTVPLDKPGDLAHGSCDGCAFEGEGFIRAHNIDLSVFASMLASHLQRNVVDKTGSKGSIDVDLKFAPEMGTKPADDAAASLPPLPIALEEQMGLHLVSTKGPVRAFVIDHLEKPEAN